MAVGLPLSGEVLPIDGVSLAASAAGLKPDNQLDTVLVGLIDGTPL